MGDSVQRKNLGESLYITHMENKQELLHKLNRQE